MSTLLLEINKWIKQLSALPINDWWLFPPVFLLKNVWQSFKVFGSLTSLNPWIDQGPPFLLTLFIFRSPCEIKFLASIFVLDFGTADADLWGCNTTMRMERGHGAPRHLWSSHFPLCARMSCCGGTPGFLVCRLISCAFIDTFVFSWLMDFPISFNIFNSTTAKQAWRSTWEMEISCVQPVNLPLIQDGATWYLIGL